MIPGIVAQNPDSDLRFVFPLTYDERDSTDTVSLSGSGSAPFITPDGFEANGYDARYNTTSLPTFVNSGTLSFAASIKVPPYTKPQHATRDSLVFGGSNDSNAYERLGFIRRADGAGETLCPEGIVALRSRTTGTTQSLDLFRPSWKYETRVPSPVISTKNCLPQGIDFIDDDTMIFSVHREDLESIVYKYDMITRTVVDEFTFGTTTNRHVASICHNAAGDYWFGDYETEQFHKVDLAASFSSGTASITQTIDCAALTGGGAFAFVTHSGTEYLIAANYVSGTNVAGQLFFFPWSDISGDTTLVLTERYKYFNLGRRMQGITCKDGIMYVARNQSYGDSTNVGVIEGYNITALLALADAAVVNITTNASVIVSNFKAPSRYPEDLAFHPTTGIMYAPTEGNGSAADINGFQGIWTKDINNKEGEENIVEALYNGSNNVDIYLNNRIFSSVGWTLSQNIDVLSIGGLPTETAGYNKNFSNAIIKNVYLGNRKISDTNYTKMLSNTGFETDTLTVYTLTITNPGAESGSTAGWTVESGGMTTRTTSPLPFAGSYYFTGGNFVSSVSRQRLDLVAQGVDTGDITTSAWATVRWMQAGFDANDPGSMGMRLLTSADATISTTYGGSAYPNKFLTWYNRTQSVYLTATTRKIDALYNASGRTGGTANDFYVDNITIKIYVP